MEAKAGPRRWHPPRGSVGAGYGAGGRRQPSACAQVPPAPGPAFEVACLLNPCTAARVGRTVGSGSLGSREGLPGQRGAGAGRGPPLGVPLALSQAGAGPGTKCPAKQPHLVPVASSFGLSFPSRKVGPGCGSHLPPPSGTAHSPGSGHPAASMARGWGGLRGQSSDLSPRPLGVNRGSCPCSPPATRLS